MTARAPGRVHYVAAGKYGMAFDCWRGDLRRSAEYPSSRARRTTSVDRVTCHECLLKIFYLVEARLRRAGYPENVRRRV